MATHDNIFGAAPGRVVRAPEGHLDATRLEAARVARRSFMGKALAIGAGAGASGAAGAVDDPAIVNLPAHSRGLGQGVAASGYGLPSTHERNLQRRASPGLTRVDRKSVV